MKRALLLVLLQSLFFPFLPEAMAKGLLEKALEGKAEVVDLSHTLKAGIPSYPGTDPFLLENKANYDKGYYFNSFSMSEHVGTHVDAPNHFVQGTASIDEVLPTELLAPAIVLKVRDKVEKDPDYLLSLEDIKDWEDRHGKIPEGAVVLMETGWASRWPKPEAYLNMDEGGVMHFPGFSKEAAEFLVKERSIKAIGIDTLSLDHGPTKDFAVHYIVHGAGKYMIENMASLDRLPEKGAVLIVAPLKIEKGSGAPARIFALFPKK